jgi:4-amino-4-deoxy-L-arabinose transferase-like glycosyltransferase
VLDGRRLYFAISGIYAITRVLLYGLGLRYHVDYAWQHFHDVDLLRDRLWESLLYTHAFTPFINLLAGVVIKISEPHAAAIYHAIFLALGCTFVNSLGHVLVGLGAGRRAVLGVVTFFSLTPAFLFFENLLHYEFITAALLALSAALFLETLRRPSFWRWFGFFLVCAVITLVRTSFHLVWLCAMLGLALAFQRERWRAILLAVLVPFALASSLYIKNQVLFGFFGTSSNFGTNMAYTTTRQLKKNELEKWIAQGKLHGVSGVNAYAGPEEYAPWIAVDEKRGIPVLDRMQKANGQPNYNHWSYAEVSKLRLQDARYYLRHRFGKYLRTVAKNYVTYMRPTSDWHPSKQAGPHVQHRQVLGGWEKLYNGVVHGFPIAPLGLYVALIPLFFVAVFRAARTLWRARLSGHVREKLVLYMAASAIYVPLLSCLVTTAELSRYRLLVEGFMWLVCAWLFVREPIAASEAGSL